MNLDGEGELLREERFYIEIISNHGDWHYWQGDIISVRLDDAHY